jgi:SAM-dependent methyltransferase
MNFNSQHEKAWNIRSYPCIGLGNYLSPALPKHPAYPEILQCLQTGTILEIGAFVGQELRKLVSDGVPQSHIYATDIVDFQALGYELYRDKEKFNVPWILCNILEPNEELEKLFGKIDVISVSHLLHQWGWDTQVKACRQLCKFSKPGSIIVGYQGGTNNIAKREEWNKTMTWAHDPDSFRRMWEVVGKETGMEWEVEAEIRPWADCGYLDSEVGYLGEDFSLLRFLIRRIK